MTLKRALIAAAAALALAGGAVGLAPTSQAELGGTSTRACAITGGVDPGPCQP